MQIIKLVLVFIILIVTHLFQCNAQIKIHGNSILKAKGVMATNASVNNASTGTDFTDVQLVLQGGTQQVLTSQPTQISMLKVNQSGVKVLSGNWEITNSLDLVNGIIQVGNAAKLSYSGSQPVEGSSISFIDGFFHNKGTGRLFFPIGSGSTYAPAVVENASSGEVGMRTIGSDALLTLPTEVSAAFAGRYWELSAPVNSPVSLSLINANAFLGDGTPVVLDAPAIGSLATSLLGTVSADFVTSTSSSTQSILAIGKLAEFRLIIHDMITPFVRDEINDRLVIENIEQATSNKVVLLDRWGVNVKEWQNYTNDTVYDFSILSPGNYVCIVDYTFPDGSRTTQKGIITVLNSK